MEARHEAALVTAARRGEDEALAELLERHRPRARAVAHRVLGDWVEAEDVAQEALLQAHLALADLRDPERFGAWLRGITLNLAKMRARQRAREPVLDVAGGTAVPAPADATTDGIGLLELVRDALSRLTPGEREVVYLHHVAGLSTAEIADRLGDTPGAVRVRLHRARARLREPLAAARAAREESQMVEMELQDVVVRIVDGDGEGPRLADPTRIVLLAERGGERVLPIWVGAPEGDALALHRAAEVLPRPLTPDLMARLVEAIGSRVDRVAVTRLEENTFYATISVAGGQELDARPSDALNLAVRTGAAIFVDDGVLEQAGIDASDLTAKLDEETEEHLGERLPGEWRSLTPELVQSFWPKRR